MTAMTAEEKIRKFASLQAKLQSVESNYKTQKDALKKKHETEMEALKKKKETKMEEIETKYDESRNKVLNEISRL